MLEAIAKKKTPAIIALAPFYSRLPAVIAEHRELNDEADVEAALDASLEFCRQVIRVVSPLVPAVKINSAYFERYYSEGIEVYYELGQEAADRDLLVIGDVKRADIGPSSEMYARAHLAEPDFSNMEDVLAPDAVTVNGYFGIDGVKPFIDIARTHEQGKGIFVLVRTSNESAADVQDVSLSDGRRFYELMATQVAQWAAESGTTGQRGDLSIGA